jgi:hypothetical protein
VIDLLQEAELVHHQSILTSLATGQRVEDETIGLQETTGLPGTIDLRETEMTVLEDAMTEMNVVMKIEIESVIGSTMTSAVEVDEPEVAAAVQSVIESETEQGRENH